jgi:hypothetical protein
MVTVRRIKPVPAIKISVSAVEEAQARAAAQKKGLHVAEIFRRALQSYLASAEAHAEVPDAIFDRQELQTGQGKRVVAAYLSPPIAGAIKKIARTERRSESSVLRELIRFELRRRGLLPSKQWGMDAVGAGAGHIDDVADAPQA